MSERFLSTKECAEMIGVKPRTLTKWHREQKEGLPKPITISERFYVWKHDEMLKYIGGMRHDDEIHKSAGSGLAESSG